jgi:hypothetical protein
MRRTLKKFTLSPRCASAEFFDKVIGANDSRLIKILGTARMKAESRIGDQVTDEWEFAEF